MASPNFDALSVQQSKNIGDPVAAATTDGKRWSSAQRSYHLNEAIRRWLRKQFLNGMIRESRTQDAGKNWENLGSYVVQGTGALTASVKSLSSFDGTNTVAHIIDCYNSTDAVPVKRLPQHFYRWAQTGGNSFLTSSATNQFFVVDGGNIRLLGGTATSTLSLRFVKAHSDLSANGSSDIAIPSQSWDQILDLAFKVAMEEVGDSESAAKGLIKEQVVNGEIA